MTVIQEIVEAPSPCGTLREYIKPEYHAKYNAKLDERMSQLSDDYTPKIARLFNHKTSGGKTTLAKGHMHLDSLHHCLFTSFEHKTQDGNDDILKDITTDLYDETVVNLIGKNRICKNSSLKPISEEYGIPLSHFCNDCFQKPDCEAFLNYKLAYSGLFSINAVHQYLHTPFIQGIVASGKIERIIIDEYLNLMDEKAFALPQIESVYKFILEAARGRPYFLHFVVKLLKVIIDGLNNKNKLKIEEMKFLSKMTVEDPIIMKTQIDEIVRNIIDGSYRKDKTKIPSLALIFKIYEILNKYQNIRDKLPGTKNEYDKSGSDMFNDDCDIFLKNTFQINYKKEPTLFISNFDNPFLDKIKCNIWILDARGSLDYYKSIFPEENGWKVIPEEDADNNQIFCPVYRLTDRCYGINSLSKPYIFKEMCELIDAIISFLPGKKILMGSVKANRIQDKLKDRYEKTGNTIFFANYHGNSRGTNEFQDCDVAILAGGAYANPFRTKKFSALSGISEDILEVCVSQDEMFQMAQRIRPNPSKVVYILSNLDLGLSGDNVKRMGYRDMKQMVSNINPLYDRVQEILKDGKMRQSELYNRIRKSPLFKSMGFVEEMVTEGLIKKTKEGTGHKQNIYFTLSP